MIGHLPGVTAVGTCGVAEHEVTKELDTTLNDSTTRTVWAFLSGHAHTEMYTNTCCFPACR